MGSICSISKDDPEPISAQRKTVCDDEWFFADKNALALNRREKNEKNYEEYKAGLNVNK